MFNYKRNETNLRKHTKKKTKQQRRGYDPEMQFPWRWPRPTQCKRSCASKGFQSDALLRLPCLRFGLEPQGGLRPGSLCSCAWLPRNKHTKQQLLKSYKREIEGISYVRFLFISSLLFLFRKWKVFIKNSFFKVKNKKNTLASLINSLVLFLHSLEN